jgi:hypothetical protein
MTIQSRVLNALRRTDRLCDDCLSEITGVTPRQSINSICRAMASTKVLSRATEYCERCGRSKKVNRLSGGVRSKDEPRTPLPAIEGAHGAAHDARIPMEIVRPSDTANAAGGEETTGARVEVDAGKTKRACFLVSCVGKKRSSPARARDLYVSDWFGKARSFVERSGQPWFILSAEHGLVHPDSVVEPYEKTLNQMSVSARRAWATLVIGQMKSLLPDCEEVVVFAGARYREFLLDYLRKRARVKIPLEGLRIGEQLSWFASHRSGNM